MKVKVRAVGRDYFWSAGRRWPGGDASAGRIVSVVANDEVPKRFFRPIYARHDYERKHLLGEELDFPAIDPEYQAWLVAARLRHDQRDEITMSDYNQILQDARFLAVEYPDAAMVTAEPKQERQQQATGQAPSQTQQPPAQQQNGRAR